MSRLDGWLTSSRTDAPTAATRAAITWVMILRNPSEITIDRDGSALPAQTVRIESQTSVNETASNSGKGVKRKITLFGVIGHPSIDDTDIQRNDRFSYNATPSGRLNYKVIHVDLTQIGQVQAEAEEIQ